MIGRQEEDRFGALGIEGLEPAAIAQDAVEVTRRDHEPVARRRPDRRQVTHVAYFLHRGRCWTRRRAALWPRPASCIGPTLLPPCRIACFELVLLPLNVSFHHLVDVFFDHFDVIVGRFGGRDGGWRDIVRRDLCGSEIGAGRRVAVWPRRRVIRYGLGVTFFFDPRFAGWPRPRMIPQKANRVLP